MTTREQQFDNKKLGIFVHWGPSCVPAFTPDVTRGAFEKVREGTEAAGYPDVPDAMFYWYNMRQPGSITAAYHERTYGSEYPYERFVEEFARRMETVSLDEIAETVRSSGARYCNLTAMHHDGFRLWPSAVTTPGGTGASYQTGRDIVGELRDLLVPHGVDMGLYLSGGYYWPWRMNTVNTLADTLTSVPGDEHMARFVTQLWAEVSHRYAPYVLWNDIGLPAGTDVGALVATFRAHRRDGVVNDRLYVYPQSAVLRALLKVPCVNRAVSWLINTLFPPTVLLPQPADADFAVLEEARIERSAPPPRRKWESTVVFGNSFGYCRQEDAERWMSTRALVATFVDVIVKGGNMLLNIGPDADGRVPTEQRATIAEFGDWVRHNAEAVFDTRVYTGDGITLLAVEPSYGNNTSDRCVAAVSAAPAPVDDDDDDEQQSVFYIFLHMPIDGARYLLRSRAFAGHDGRWTAHVVGGGGVGVTQCHDDDELTISVPHWPPIDVAAGTGVVRMERTVCLLC